jgi:hypothetical protein
MGCPVAWSAETIIDGVVLPTVRTVTMSVHNGIPNVSAIDFTLTFDPAYIQPAASPFINLPSGATMSNIVNGSGTLSARINFSPRVDIGVSEGDGDPVVLNPLAINFNVLAKPANNCAININSSATAFNSSTVGVVNRPTDYGRIVFQGPGWGCPAKDATFIISPSPAWQGQQVSMTANYQPGIHFWRIGANNNMMLGMVTYQASYTYPAAGIYAITHQVDDNGLVGFATQNVTVNGITTGTVISNLCIGSAVSVPFTISAGAVFIAGNIFTAQVSDAAGSFANPVNIGTLTGTSSGTINATLPANLQASGNYRIRVTASSPSGVNAPVPLIGSDNGSNISISTNCGALSFDGNDRVVIPHNAAYNFGTGNFTLEAWVKIASGTSTATALPLISKKSGSTTGTFAFFVKGTTLILQLNGVNSTSAVFTNIYNSACHHVAVTRSSGTVTFYVDGVQRGTATNAQVVSSANAVNIAYDPVANNFLAATVDDIRFWNVARTATEIANNRSINVAPNSTGLKGLWDFNEGSGQVVYDGSLTGNHGSLGTNSTAADAGDPTRSLNKCFVPALQTGLAYDAFDDRVTVPSHANYSVGTGAFTIEAWVRMGTTSSSKTPILSKRPGAGNVSGFVFMTFNSGTQLLMQIDANNLLSSTIPTLYDNNCHHVAVTRSSAGAVSFYLDGTFLNSLNQSASMNSLGAMYIGFDSVDRNSFRGNIDEIRFWNTQRTAAQITSNRAVILPSNTANLIGYFRLKEPSDQTIIDASSTANNGFLGSNSLRYDVQEPLRSNASCFSTDRLSYSEPLIDFPDTTNGGTSSDVMIYPNPFSTEANILIKGADGETSAIKVLDINGKQVEEGIAENNKIMKIGSHLPSGLYIIQIVRPNMPRTYKIIKIE